MNRTLIQSLMLVAGIAFAGMAGADGGQPAPNAKVTASAPDFRLAESPEPQRRRSATRNCQRWARKSRSVCHLQKCAATAKRRLHVIAGKTPDSEACRAQLAAKYAEMDKLCRIVSGPEFPICIKSAYSAD